MQKKEKNHKTANETFVGRVVERDKSWEVAEKTKLNESVMKTFSTFVKFKLIIASLKAGVAGFLGFSYGRKSKRVSDMTVSQNRFRIWP
jgi:hypothetical protein